MRAVIQNAVGGPDVLFVAEQPDPSPKPGEVLVRVKAAGINPVDGVVRGGFYPLLGEPPFILGWDISGTVAALGAGVTEFKVGDDVFGMPHFPKQAGAYAELATAPVDEIAAKPAAIDHAQAAALPLAGLTAWQGLVRHGGLQAGQRALIHAGAGGVGHLAVQIAKARGAHVIATASPDKTDFVRSIGADEVIDYTKGDFTEQVRNVDLVLDGMGGDHADGSLKVVRDGGVLVSLLDVRDATRTKAKERNIRVERMSVVPDREGLVELARLVDADKLVPHVAKAFPLDQAEAAHAFLATRPIGKVVLTV
ncbi:NADP-dependent oxidoreductase [Mesorhizobium sp. M2D.F.Ca.ET.185.01.1.1]|uniref:NADP-dependent oxidoreductase n=1 Tax=unclassified Mesorhizobium TaxID=325217 RepID=UPI000FCCCD75|nr:MULTISPECIES: NADP-dependent oxidoreductase [unclassified Mesorhizobium]TGP82536.1 NADP-dependent oxidoreductase [bacterium M00.F.Ca.ET.227.01.1.1]TGP94291.1 NADP-dependent oxidoreductase [bacterium M00.F.Ca.ET.221.01.1.1]TGP97746.1 NADP-dependent oxidoreductase [bacterium M00.F.Ca.ET.222.01.1.1]TGT75209.1 NADP-dependent oxidoreductase [bacterium M00.F.Ca.ET.159.01.1.1]TGT88076.1 NADP-dependent oxidoreductase [bacterium M00.F.Ca.ET.157.01.1.1]TGU11944.1 NADP-dependent oxidoreductase [bacte